MPYSKDPATYPLEYNELLVLIIEAMPERYVFGAMPRRTAFNLSARFSAFCVALVHRPVATGRPLVEWPELAQKANIFRQHYQFVRQDSGGGNVILSIQRRMDMPDSIAVRTAISELEKLFPQAASGQTTAEIVERAQHSPTQSDPDIYDELFSGNSTPEPSGKHTSEPVPMPVPVPVSEAPANAALNAAFRIALYELKLATPAATRVAITVRDGLLLAYAQTKTIAVPDLAMVQAAAEKLGVLTQGRMS